MSWSDNLKAYLGNAGYQYACLYTVDGKNCFAEAGSQKEKIGDVEILNAVKSVGGDQKYQGVTIGGTKYVYLIDNAGVYAFKKMSKACLFFHGAAYACFIFAEAEPRVLMSAAIDLKSQLATAGLQ